MLRLAVGLGLALAAPRAAQPASGLADRNRDVRRRLLLVHGGRPSTSSTGVISTTSGYTGGRTPNPTYEQVSAGGTGHTEALQVIYDPAKVSYDTLLEVFWRNVDAGRRRRPVLRSRQPVPSGASSYHSDGQQQLAEASKERIARAARQADRDRDRRRPARSTTAEDYHQDYYKKNPVRYKFYKWNCGRAQRLEALWGKASGE